MAKKILNLRRNAKETILEDMTYYELPVHISTGLLMEKMEGGDTELYLGVDENDNEIIATIDEVVTARFNKKVLDRVGKYTRYILGIRGVKNVDDIDINDSEVKEMLRQRRQENKAMSGSANLSDTDKLSCIQLIKQKHEPQYRSVVFEVILWAILTDDLFKTVKTKQGTALECRLDIEITDDLFDVEQEFDDLDTIFMGSKPKPIEIDKNQAIEVAIAVVKKLVNDNDSLAETLGQLAGVAFTHLAMLGEDADDEGVFRTTVASVLPDFMVKANNNSVGNRLRGGVQFVSKKTVEHGQRDEEPQEQS